VPGSYETGKFAERLAEDMLIQKHQGIEGLILRAGRHLPAYRQILKKRDNLIPAACTWVSVVTKRNKPGCPALICLLGPYRVGSTPHLGDESFE
jgi:hypothetical protein